MNKVILVGRLTKDPELRVMNNAEKTAVSNYTLAVDRRFRKEGSQQADFIKCTAFGRFGEFASKYFRKGMRVSVSGRLQTDSYTDRDGKKVYTVAVIVEEQEFAQSKNENAGNIQEDSQDTWQKVNDDDVPWL